MTPVGTYAEPVVVRRYFINHKQGGAVGWEEKQKQSAEVEMKIEKCFWLF